MLFNKRLAMFNFIFASLLLASCQNNEVETRVETTPLANDYWYDGKAEVSSYTLKQARYGEIHEGSAVMIFVTEQFSKKSWAKADNPSDKDIPVMKLNFTKSFNTGIYPYSMMTSTFFPFDKGKNAVKVSTSIQEWCGHTYMELRNKKKYDVRVDSYFEGESAKDITLEKDYLEDDFWTIIRLNPNDLPQGKAKVIPSFFYIRLTHEELKAYDCEMTLKMGEETSVYTIHYPGLERDLRIDYESSFPHRIISWEETYYSGWGEGRKLLSTNATLNQSLRTDYWSKNTVADSLYRKQLGLD